ncbi:MAG: 4Fe-4S dicluster domain-containing protein [Planctomycetota bacterium]
MLSASGMLIDLSRCIGCRACQAACKQWHGLPAESTRNTGSYENPPARSAKTWTTITFHEVDGGGPLRWVFAKRQCMHCLDPGCAAACPVGALHATPEGPVVYDDARCIGCRYCMLACPFGVPTFEWEAPVPYIRKCTLCADRLAGGMQPACSKACPTGALRFGVRKELLEEAHSRIRARPRAYVDRVYGEREAGGTSKLYLSPVPFARLGFPEPGPEPVSRYAETAMRAVPFAAAAAAAAVAGARWIVRRRDEVKGGAGEE